MRSQTESKPALEETGSAHTILRLGALRIPHEEADQTGEDRNWGPTNPYEPQLPDGADSTDHS